MLEYLSLVRDKQGLLSVHALQGMTGSDLESLGFRPVHARKVSIELQKVPPFPEGLSSTSGLGEVVEALGGSAELSDRIQARLGCVTFEDLAYHAKDFEDLAVGESEGVRRAVVVALRSLGPQYGLAEAKGAESFGKSNYKRWHDETQSFKYQDEFFAALREFLIVLAMAYSYQVQDAEATFEALQRKIHEKASFSEYVDTIANLSVRLWSSTVKCFGNKEFSSLLNQVIRNDGPDKILKAAMKLVKAINRILVNRNPGAGMVYPNDMKTYRGTGIPNDIINWFKQRTEGKYRAPMFLASSFVRDKAKDFLDQVPAGLTHVLMIFHIHAKCKHAVLIESLSDVAEEREFLFVPYSAFTIRKVTAPTGAITALSPVTIDLDVCADNKAESEDLPLASWH